MPNDSHRDLPDVSLFASPGFDGSGYVICQSDANNGIPCNLTTGEVNFLVVGGTSASAPAFAGVMALINQKESTAQNPAPRQGNANYVLYALAKKSGASCASIQKEAAGCTFNDITHGNSYIKTQYGSSAGTNSVPCKGGSLNCSVTSASENGVLVETTSSTTEAWTVTTGYDLATGLGSVNINNLATNWGTVSTVATTTTLTLSPTTGITHGTGENVTVNIAVTPKSGTATGDVSLIATISGPNGSTTQGLDQFTLNTSGKVVNGTTTSLPGGTNYQVYAHYAGDGTNAPSDSAPVSVTVGKETSQTFIVVPTFNSSGNQTSGNTSSVPYGSFYIISLFATDKNAVASSTGPPNPACYQVYALTCPTGTITLTDGGAPLGTGGGGAGVFNLSSSGYTQDLAVNLLGGTHTLSATYSGDNSYQSSTSATTTFVVTPALTSLTLAAPSNPVVGIPNTITANGRESDPNGGVAPTGTITVYDGSSVLGSPVTFLGYEGPGAGFSIGVPVTFASGGNHSLTAKYSGDANYGSATTSAQIVHALYLPTLNVQASSTNIPYGTSITVTATVNTGQKTPTITGQITFGSTSGLDTISVGPTTQGTDSSGNLILQATATLVPQVTEYFYASYAGDSNYAPTGQSFVTLTVNIPDFTLGPPNGLNVIAVAGQPASGQVSITPLTQTPSTVQLSFLNSAPIIFGYNITLSPQQVNLNGSMLPATVTITPSNSAPLSVMSSKPRHAGLYPFERRNWWLLSFATALAGLWLLGRSQRRKRFRTALGLAAASFIFLILGCGGGGGSVGQGGGGGTGGSGSGGSLQPTTITLTTSNAKVSQTGTFTLTATVSGQSPTGTVQFYNYGSSYGLPVILTNGQAQTQGISNSVALYKFTASYSGDSNNKPSTSTASVTQVVTGTVSYTVVAATGGDIHILNGYVGLQ
jgi:hypothetical protein